jgi:cell filamentation protein
MAKNEKQPPSRYRTDPGIEGEFESGSRGRVLRNKLGISSKRKMDHTEFEALVSAQEKYLSIITAETTFTADLVCAMHRDWLGAIYPWAGQYRSVELSKGRFAWPPARLVAQNMATVERETLRRLMPCRTGPLHGIAAGMACVQAELLVVHPFREGNGRTARWVTDLLALQAELPPLDYGFTGPGSQKRRRAYLAAVIDGYRKNYEPLARLLAEAIERALEDTGRR